MKKSKILVTGGAGYIGSQTAYYLIDHGFDVAIVDNLTVGNKSLVPDKAKFFQADLSDNSSIVEILKSEKIDGVIHFAASSQVGESQSNPAKYYVNNVAGTLSLLESMREAGVKNIVFSSTAAVFGEPEKIPINEQAETKPINTYGHTKLMIEQILSDYHRAYEFSIVIFRYFNACGADLESRTGETHDPETHLIPILLDTAGGLREEFSIFGDDYKTPDGTCIRDYIHTVDLASAHHLAMKKILNEQTNRFSKYNLGTQNGYSVKEIYEKAQQIVNKPIKKTIAPKRAGDPDKLIADSSLVQSELGWKPKYSDLDTIISTAWAWHQKWHN